MHLTWRKPPDKGDPISLYMIYVGTVPGGEAPVSATTTTNFDYFPSGKLTTYYFQVSAINAPGESPRSNEVASVPDT